MLTRGRRLSGTLKPHRMGKRPRAHVNMTNRIRSVRQAQTKKLKQADVANKLSNIVGFPVSRSTYASVESGTVMPHKIILDGLTKIFNCRDTDLFAGVYLDMIQLESSWSYDDSNEDL